MDEQAGPGASVPAEARQRLSRRVILEAGARIIEERGLARLSMRLLGTELGVEAMSLYRYVPSRENLLDGIVDLVIDELYADPDVHMAPDDGWQDYLVRLAQGVRRMALRHPQVFPLVATRPPEAPWLRPPLRSLRWVESFLASLTASGFSHSAAVAAYRAFSSFLLGHLLLEVSARGAQIGPVPDAPQPPPQAAEGAQDSGSDARPADAHPGEGPLGDLRQYPLICALQEELAADHAAVEFEESLENLLNRLELLTG